MQILHGDCLAILPTLADSSIDAIVTDPPYCLDSVRKRFGPANSKPTKLEPHQRTSGGFMGKLWDTDIAFHPDVWRECLRVLKPGAHVPRRTERYTVVALLIAAPALRKTLDHLIRTVVQQVRWVWVCLPPLDDFDAIHPLAAQAKPLPPSHKFLALENQK